MIGEVDIEGVYIPTLLVCGVIAFLLNLVLQRILSVTGVYRWVWHHTLFNVALFAIFLAFTTAIASRLLEP